jgi:5'-3' exonuclease
VRLHLVDGTYELFRAHFGAPEARAPDGREVGATRGLGRSLLSLVMNEGATHVAVAFDTVVESFRNDLFDGYKTGEGLEAELHDQFPLAERMTHALGLVVWSMVEFEADDALASGAARFRDDETVEKIYLCTPDKDLAQCISGDRIVGLDRRRRQVLNEAGVVEKFGVQPASMPDWLGLVGDSADGIPGIPRWGARSAATVLAEYERIESIPDDHEAWRVKVRGAATLARNLSESRETALLYRELAVLRRDVALVETVDDLEWRGARRKELEQLTGELGDERLVDRVPRWRD